MLRRLRGMYAFAIWDDRQRRLLLARDPYGIKPLYYSVSGGSCALRRRSRLFRGAEVSGAPLNQRAWLASSFGRGTEPWTVWREIRALPAGHLLDVVQGRVGQPQSHSELGDAASEGPADVVAALEDSVRAHLVADVPVGVFLSAGLDSALVAALMKRNLEDATSSLHPAFDELRGTPFDEAPGAIAMARALGLRHLELRVSKAELGVLWLQALKAMDQPSVDGFNTFLVSHYASRAGLKVVMSGLGGDELFGSYPSFIRCRRGRKDTTGRRDPWPRDGLGRCDAKTRPKTAQVNGSAPVRSHVAGRLLP